jgi:hypothetical protein
LFSHGLFLSLKYIGELNTSVELEIPKMTYVSAPMQIINAGNKVTFEDLEWSGVYQLKGSRVWMVLLDGPKICMLVLTLYK